MFLLFFSVHTSHTFILYFLYNFGLYHKHLPHIIHILNHWGILQINVYILIYLIILLLDIYVASGILRIIKKCYNKNWLYINICLDFVFFSQGSFLIYWLRSMNILSHSGKYLLFSVDTHLFQLSNLSLQFSICY